MPPYDRVPENPSLTRVEAGLQHFRIKMEGLFQVLLPPRPWPPFPPPQAPDSRPRLLQCSQIRTPAANWRSPISS